MALDGVLRIDPPQCCISCGREVRISDRAVVFDTDNIWHANCYLARAEG